MIKSEPRTPPEPRRLASTGVVYDLSDRFITFSQLSIGLAA